MSKIITGNFINSLPEGNILLLFLNNEELCYAVADKATLTYNAFDVVKFAEGDSPLLKLKELLNTSEILATANYRKVIFCSGFRKSTIVPSALFDEQNLKQQLGFSHELVHDDEILTDDIATLQAVNIYAVPNTILKLLSDQYNNLEVYHSSTSTITYLLANRTEHKSKSIFVIVHEKYFEVIIIDGYQLTFYNTFSYTNNEEFVYYILFVCEQLTIDPSETGITFSGTITEQSEKFILISKYFSNVSLSNRPDNFIYPDEFSILPGTFHYYLFSQLICVS